MSFSKSGIIVKKKKGLNIIKDNEKDKKALNIIEKDKRSRNKMLILEGREISQTLKNIKSKFKFSKTPLIQKIKEENNKFKTNYNLLNNNKKEKKINLNLEDLILQYKEKGYKIPKFSSSNDIFNSNALIENDTEKMIKKMINNNSKKKVSKSYSNSNINIIKENEKKILLYIYKLNKLIDDKLHKQNFLENFNNELNQNLINLNQNQEKNIEESDKELLIKIKSLLNLINEAEKDYNKSKKKLLRLPSKNYSKQFSNKINQSSSQKLISIPISLSKSTFNKSNNINKNNLKNTFSSNDILLNNKKEKIIKSLKSYPPIFQNKTKKNYNKENNIKNIVLNPKRNNNKKEYSNYNNYHNLIKSRSSSRSTIFSNRYNLSENKKNDCEEICEISYKKLFLGNNNKDTLNILKQYLQKIKNYSNEELNNIWEAETKANLLNNVIKIKDIIKKGKIKEKSEKIYLNNSLIQRIKPKLQKMIDTDRTIQNFEKDYIKSLISD